MTEPKKKKTAVKPLRLLESFGLPVLYAICGILALLEARRIQIKLKVDNFFAGPSGYMSILGVILLLLFIPEIRDGLKKYRRLLEEDAQKAEITKTDEEISAEEKEKADSKRMWIVFGMLVVYVAVIKYLGFVISTLVFLVSSLFFLGNKWKSVLFTTLVIGVFLYFCPQIGITLPKGIFGI